MSSSGLIYAVIVGAWAAYLVPMWLRRQDELNEARPTERFSTAIRLLSGRAAMERRYAKSLDNPDEEGPGKDAEADSAESAAGHPNSPAHRDGARTSPAAETVDVRSLAVPAEPQPAPPAKKDSAAKQNTKPQPAAPRRAQVLARRRRTTTALFLAFTAGTVAAAVGGLAFLWAPAAPGALLTVYIVHLRRQERRRFEAKLDHRRAAEAAKRVRERSRAASAAAAERKPAKPASADEPAQGDRDADRRALVEETDHAEWVDGLQRQATDEDSWEPVPVPLPTYVTAPVAPRGSRGVDLGAADAWSSARSGPAAVPEQRDDAANEQPAAPHSNLGRRARERGGTPLFDQYAAEDRPRAANE